MAQPLNAFRIVLASLVLSQPATSQGRPAADKALHLIRAVVAADSVAATKDVASDHLWTEFGSSAKAVHGKAQLMQGRQSLRDAATAPELDVKRVIANRRVVLVQGVIRGQANGRAASSEMFYLAWVREGEIKRSIVYWGSDVLRDSTLGRGAAAARLSAPEVVAQAPSVKLDSALIGKLYAFASYALGARLAGLDGRTDIAREALHEVSVNVAASRRKSTRDYLRTFSKTSLSLDQLYQAGVYTIATFTANGTFTGTLAGASGRNQQVQLQLLVVANLRGRIPRSLQSYVDLTDLRQKLGIM